MESSFFSMFLLILLSFFLCESVALFEYEDVRKTLVHFGGPSDLLPHFDPRELLNACDDLGSQCTDDVRRFNGSLELLWAYGNFSVEVGSCVKKFVFENCWDTSQHKWKQGKCNIGDQCLGGKLNSLYSACDALDGGICNGMYSFGVAGAYVEIILPSCTPKSCHNHDDMKSLSSCLNENSCARLPAALVTSCSADLGCYHDSNASLYVTFSASSFLLVSLSALLFLLWSGILPYRILVCKFRNRSSNRDHYQHLAQSAEADAGTINSPLLENGNGVAPLSGNQGEDLADLRSLIPEGQNKYIVEGTPSLLNTRTLMREMKGEVNGDIEESRAEHDNGRPQFKLSTPFERHIIKGFKFRHQELRDHKGKSGWGAGSTSASSMVWRSIFFKSKGNLILKGVSGYIKPGMCLACVGAPDSGATSLIKLLAGRVSSGRVSGEILVDGYPPSANMKKILAYIPKEDLNIPTLTVRETLEFSLNMRSPSKLPERLRKDRVNVVLSLLGLSHVSDTIVGDAVLRGISGGEKRRVSLGVELVVGRSLLLASQPTNGLDSSAAYDVIKATRALSDTGLAAFMATISQPSPELLMLFDTICMISRGSCVYFGPTAEVQSFLFGCGFVCPSTKSLPDFLEEVTGSAYQFHYDSVDQVLENNAATGEEQTLGSAENSSHGKRIGNIRRESISRQSLVTAFRESRYYKELGLAIWGELENAAIHREKEEQALEYVEIAGDQHANYGDVGHSKSWIPRVLPTALLDDDGLPCFWIPSEHSAGLWNQFKYCLMRQVMIVLRSPTLKVRIGRALFQGFLIGNMFFQLDNDQQGATNRYGLMFLSLSTVFFGSLAAIPELFSLRQVYYAQRSAGYFRPLAYYFCLLIIEVPLVFLETFLYCMLVYSMCGLRNGLLSWNFIYFWLSVVVQGVSAWLMCFVVIMASPSEVVAQAVCPTFVAIFSLFCGFLVLQKDMAAPVRWLWDFNPISRGLKGMVINEVDGLSYYCKPDQLWPPPNSTLLAEPTYRGNEYSTCPLSSGGATLFMFDYDKGETNKWILLATNVLFPVFFTLALLIVMYTIQYESDSPDSARDLIKARIQEKQKAFNSNSAKNEADAVNESDVNSYTRLHVDESNGIATVAPKSLRLSGCLEFSNLCYSVDIPQGSRFAKPLRKQLLFDVSGYACPGAIVALMGASGAGKSTLLDILANKKTGGYIDSDCLLVNGRERDGFFPRIAGYVEQTDSHLPTHTVREAIEASATLRLPRELSKADRKNIVERIIAQLGLGAFQDSLIGTPMNVPGISGVSPEIRKKTTIAVELAMEPAILFLDEPTTGLDGASALAVMQALREACSEKATMCTIHQPSSEVFSLFDWMLLLQEGGRVVYFGPVDNMNTYFSKYGFGTCRPGSNPADFALSCSRMIVNNVCAADVWDNSEEKVDILQLAPRHRHERGETIAGYDQDCPFDSYYASSFFQQLKTLFRIQFFFLARDTALLKMRVVTSVAFGFIIALLFYNSKLDVAGAKARIALCFISITYVGYCTMLVIPQMINQRAVHFREFTSNYYTLVPYFMATTLSEIPFIFLQIGCYLITFYPFVGLRTEPSHIARFSFGMVVLNLVTSAFSYLVAALSPNADSGVIINNVCNGIFTLFCGFLVPYESIPLLWKPLYFISEFRYPLGFLVSSELHGRKFGCPDNENAVPIFVAGSDPHAPPFPFGDGPYNVECPSELIFDRNITKLLDNPECFRYYCPVQDGDTLLRQFNFPMDEEAQWKALSTMIVFYFVWRVLGYVALRKVQWIKR